MALSESTWQTSSVQQLPTKPQEVYHPYSSHPVSPDPNKAQSRALPPGLKFQDNRSLLQGEDVEVFFKHLEDPTTDNNQSSSSDHTSDLGEPTVKTELDPDLDQNIESKNMFQNSMHAMPVPGTAPTYHDSPGSGAGAITSMHSATVNPVYVPTTRAVLPPMPYMSNGTAQVVSNPSSPAMWPMNSDTTYSSANAHSSVSSRFPFAPSPSSPISTPTGRTDSSFAAPIARPPGINPYSYMPTTDISSWNFQMALQQGLRQTGPGE